MREQLLGAPPPGRARTLNTNIPSLHRRRQCKRHVRAMGRLLEYGCQSRYVAASVGQRVIPPRQGGTTSSQCAPGDPHDCQSLRERALLPLERAPQRSQTKKCPAESDANGRAKVRVILTVFPVESDPSKYSASDCQRIIALL